MTVTVGRIGHNQSIIVSSAKELVCGGPGPSPGPAACRRRRDEMSSPDGLAMVQAAFVDAIPAWVEEGRRRAARAGLPPFSGGVCGP